MVIDTSALVAILLGEPEARTFNSLIETDPVRLIAAPTLLECTIVIQQQLDDQGVRELDLVIHTASIQTVSFTDDHYKVARQAHRRYGKGRHRAGLNYGDCMSYALSRTSGEPLLFKGNDFVHTDIVAVRAPSDPPL